MYGNHKPEIRGTDDALWSRVKLVEFPVSFADRVNTTCPPHLRAELSGILNWAIAGCLAWQQEGLTPPEKVQVATQAYRQEQDVIGQFIAERCDTGEDYMRCKASMLYGAYRQWLRRLNIPPSAKNVLGPISPRMATPLTTTPRAGIFRLKIALKALPDDDDEAEADWSANLRQPSSATTKASVTALGNQSLGN